MNNSVRDKVIKIRTNNHCITLQGIGDICGISRERVRQILKESGNETCSYKRIVTYKCLVCGKEYHPSQRTTTSKKFCSKECRYNYNHPIVECIQCHNLFKISTINQLIRYNNSFCSRTCKSKYYGFKMMNNGRTRIHDYNKVKELYLSGNKYMIISQILNIKCSSISKIINHLHKYENLPYLNNRKH